MEPPPAPTGLPYRAVLLELHDLVFCTELEQPTPYGAPGRIPERKFNFRNSNRKPEYATRLGRLGALVVTD